MGLLTISITIRWYAVLKKNELYKAAEAACAEDDTMKNMPFEVTAGDVLSAMKAADQIAVSLKKA